MFRRFSVNFALFSMGLDAVLAGFALAVATYIRPYLSVFSFPAEYPEFIQIPLLLYVIFPVSWVAMLLLFSVYDGRRNIYMIDEFISLTLGSFLAGVAMAGALYLSYREVSRLLFLVFLLLGYLSLLSWRMVARFSNQIGNGRTTQQRRVLILGAGPVGRQLQQQITQHHNLGLILTGFLDDDPDKLKKQKEILGPLERARQIITEREIDDVVIALPQHAYERVNTLVTKLHDLPVKVWIIPDYFQLALHKAVIEEFAGIPMLDLRAPALSDYQRMVKRAFELVVTAILLPPALILMGIISIAIRMEGSGSILFQQQRVGENGRLFGMYKFRTMVPEAEKLRHLVEREDEDGYLIHKSLDDPRVTRVGRFLRRSSLDELPQVFNVLKGEMCLVGPRPEMPHLVEKYEPWQRKRFAVPQGITGWWQISGRSDRPMHLHTEDDLYYVQHYSILLDVQILFKTIWVVLRGSGAF